jgi:hypothetical protein
MPLTRTALAAATLALAAVLPASADRIPLEPGPDTTVFDGPLRADGTVDYIAALNNKMSEGVTADTNAFVELWLLHSERENAEGDDPTAKMLGLDTLPEGPVYTPWQVFLEDKGLGDDHEQNTLMYDIAMEGPFTREELPVVAAWLDRNGPALDRVMAAVDRPRFYAPWNTGPDDTTGMVVGVLLPHLGQYRDYARSLVLRLHLDLAEGETGAVVDSLLAIRRLAAHVAGEPTLISNLVGVSIEALAAGALETALTHGGLSEHELGQLADHWSPGLGRLEMAETVDLGERLFMLDLLQQAWAGRLGGDAEQAAFVTMMLGDGDALAFTGVMKLVQDERFDINAALRASNAAYDELMAVLETDSYPAFMERIDAYESELGQGLTDAQTRQLIRAARGEEVRGLSTEAMTTLAVRGMQHYLMPALGAARRSEYAGMVSDDLAQIAIAIERYRLATGQLPATLEDLEKHRGELFTTDRFNEQPLTYLPDQDGRGYTIYSVGRNLTDEGGLDQRSEGDLVFRVGVAE